MNSHQLSIRQMAHSLEVRRYNTLGGANGIAATLGDEANSDTSIAARSSEFEQHGIRSTCHVGLKVGIAYLNLKMCGRRPHILW